MKELRLLRIDITVVLGLPKLATHSPTRDRSFGSLRRVVMAFQSLWVTEMGQRFFRVMKRE
jgi:hypothetical protein